ncbi:MAG: serine/threonine protein kinase, partial [Deltaproteobacteria bacterium]
LDEANFINEINQMAKLYRCPNILQFILAERHGDTFYIVTEYAEGGNLRELLREKKQLPLPQALDITEQILKGLKAAHDQRIMHRDIKPENILISGDLMKISDFGVAKAVESTAASMLTHIGTPAYMAPEQFSGKGYGFNADLYSVGIILYEMLTGEKPKATFRERMRGNSLEVPSHYPKVLRTFLLKSTRFDPKRRYQNADEMLSALLEVKEALGLQPVPATSFDRSFVSFEEAKTNVTGGVRLSLALLFSRKFPRFHHHLVTWLDRGTLAWEEFRRRGGRRATGTLPGVEQPRRFWITALVATLIVVIGGVALFRHFSAVPIEEFPEDPDVWDFPKQRIRVGNEANIEVQSLPLRSPPPEARAGEPVSSEKLEAIFEETEGEEMPPEPLLEEGEHGAQDARSHAPQADFVTVAIYSSPQNSEIYINHRRTKHRTPDHIRLEAGKRYTITVRKEGYVEETKEILVRSPKDKTT